jgi:beta-glucosidase
MATCVKHFAAYGGAEAGRDYNTVEISERLLRECYLPGYKACVDAGTTMLMPSFNSLNGVPAIANPWLMKKILKEEWGFKGVVITDDIGMGGVRAMYDYETLVVELVNAGNDVLLSSEPETVDIIEKAVKDGRISEERIDDAAQRILDMKEKLGLFDESYGELAYTSQEALAETRRVDTLVAEKSITLLRDRNNLFPIDREKTKRISIIVSSHYEKYIENLEVFKEELDSHFRYEIIIPK